jgi:hypothetical protein
MVDFRNWTVKPQGGTEVVWPEIGLAYGVTSRWTTELLLSYIGSSQMATRLSTLNWQNDVLLTQGELPFDLALHMLMTSNRRDPDYSAVELGPVFQTDVGRTQLNANLFFEHHYGPQAPNPTFLKYQWQVRHRWMRQLHVGVQGFGEVGPWDDWLPREKQSHRAGPALFTTVPLAEDQALRLQAAYLIGKTYGRSGHEFTMRAVYEF